MSLTYLLDEDMSPQVAEGLRRRGIDAVSVHEVERGNRRISDEDQLAYAAAAGRVLFTFNRRDYQLLDALWRSRGRAHAGIIWCTERIVARRDVGQLVRSLDAAASANASLGGVCIPLQSADRP